MQEGYPLTPFPSNIGLASPAKPWKTIYRMLGMVLLLYILSQFVVVIFIGLLDADFDGFLGPSDPIMMAIGSICSLPLISFAIFLTRPKLTHVLRAYPHPHGQTQHPVGGDRFLQTQQPTVFQHHLVQRDVPLQIPETKILWTAFFSGVAISAMALFPLVLGINALSVSLALVIALPAWIVGFSTPVFAWWGFSSKHLGITTTQREGELMLIAGMLSTFPALVINSILFPAGLYEIFGLDPNLDYLLVQNLTIVISAPVGEEICKFLAVICLYKLIDSPRRGFQIGFTVGLGFAMLENLQYILISLLSDQFAAFSYSFTSIIRGIGSIPGHAIWTGLSGYSVGWFLNQKSYSKYNINQEETVQKVENWITFDANSGMQTSSAGDGNLPASYFSRILLSGKNTNFPVPKTILFGIFWAIFGHMFWNGSSFIISFLLAGYDEILIVIVELLWIVVMISLLWIVGKQVLQTALSSPIQKK